MDVPLINRLKTKEYFTFSADEGARDIVKDILKTAGLKQNFLLRTANCKDLIAGTSGETRYLLYNSAFMNEIQQKKPWAWIELGVLVHAIGHHLVGHDFQLQDERERKKEELEVDRFTGMMLYKLGGSERECNKYINYLGSIKQSEAYPPFKARMEAVRDGWLSVKNMDIANTTIGDPDNKKNDNGDIPASGDFTGERRYSPSMANFLNARFPFPPPECHTSHEIPVAEFSDCSTLGDVATKIESTLKEKKYPYKFMSVPGGMAIVAQMEQI